MNKEPQKEEEVTYIVEYDYLKKECHIEFNVKFSYKKLLEEGMENLYNTLFDQIKRGLVDCAEVTADQKIKK